MIDLSGVDQVLALATRQVDAVPLTAVEREPRDGQCLTLGAGLLDPVVASARAVAAVSYLRDDTFEPDRAGVLVHLGAVDLEALANWMSLPAISFFKCALRSTSGSFR